MQWHTSYWSIRAHIRCVFSPCGRVLRGVRGQRGVFGGTLMTKLGIKLYIYWT
jgi:hypothetical protein